MLRTLFEQKHQDQKQRRTGSGGADEVGRPPAVDFNALGHDNGPDRAAHAHAGHRDAHGDGALVNKPIGDHHAHRDIGQKGHAQVEHKAGDPQLPHLLAKALERIAAAGDRDGQQKDLFHIPRMQLGDQKRRGQGIAAGGKHIDERI